MEFNNIDKYHVMYDIVLVSVPYTIVETPPLGIAVLKGAVESQGFKSKTLDLGLELLRDCNHNRLLFDSLQEYFATPDLSVDHSLEFIVSEFIDKWAKKLSELETTWLGISVFSNYSQLATYMLCEKIKQLNPNIKIVIGGPGAGIQINTSMHEKYKVSSVEKLMKFGEVLTKRKLIDQSILGDGEEALVDLLNGSAQPDVFHMAKYKDQEHPYANFDDFDLPDYTGQLNRGYTQLPLFSSKGCVRKCDFCDVAAVQSKFRFRSGKNIVNEMIYLADRYNLRDFVFLDSLVNGSIKILKEWVTELAKYNKENPDKKITWAAAGWICRPIGQMPLDIYPLLAESGCTTVTIGVESGSNHVLDSMNKQTNVEALHFEAEQLSKNNIGFIALLLVGHWSETWNDFLQTIAMVYKISKYTRLGKLVSINPGGTYELYSDTPAYFQTEKNRLKTSPSGSWWTELNPGLTVKERFFRLLLLEKFLKTVKTPLMQQISGLVYNKLMKNFDDYNEFYSANLEGKHVDQYAEYYYDHFDEFLKLVLGAEKNNPINFEFEFESSVTNNDPPVIEISVNQQVLYKAMLTEGTHSISLPEVPVQDRNKLEIVFSNKKPNDTIVDNKGTIVKDKFVLVKKFIVDGIDLFKDQEFFYKKLKYYENNIGTDVRPGFWHNNSSLVLEFDDPFLAWYNHNTENFSQFEGFIVTETTGARTRSLTNEDFEKFRNESVKILKQMKC